MKIYKEQVRTIKSVDKILCDWCKVEVRELNEDFDEDINISYKLAYDAWGDFWIEDKSWGVDLCRDCMEKVRKFLEDSGCSMQEYEKYRKW